MRRIAVFVYGVLVYVMFLGVFLYLAGFIGNLVVPTTIDGPAEGPLGVALAVNTCLVLLFGLQHTLMARPRFKRWLTRMIPVAAERSTYVLMTNLALIVMFWQWRPMGGVVWDVHAPVARGVLYGLFAIGWLIVLAATCLINHFDLFGLRQVWLYLQGKPYTHLGFVLPGPYRHIRHPLYVGWMITFWATPTMTVAHLVFAIGLTAYIVVAIYYEERDLIAKHGGDYVEYRRRTPMFIPRLRGRRGATPTAV